LTHVFGEVNYGMAKSKFDDKLLTSLFVWNFLNY